MNKRIIIIGGGAAGYFSAINIAEKIPEADIIIYEASNKVLGKVLVSGGGRCNVTNRISIPSQLIKYYPRGENFLQPVFEQFTSTDTLTWFENRGVPIKIEGDGRAFPKSDSSQSIYDCLTEQTKKLGIKVVLGSRLNDIELNDTTWKLTINDRIIEAEFVVLCTGSNQKIYKLLKEKDIDIVPPVPSLFTFNAKKHNQMDLAGVSLSNASIRIMEIPNASEQGPLLITHWGYSAPAILRLSAWYARHLSELNYSFRVSINWNSYDEDTLRAQLKSLTTNSPKSKVISWKEHGLPKRLWHYLFEQSNLKDYTNWSEIGKKGINRLVANLSKFEVSIEGKTTFKEEFVTAGGIDLAQVDPNTMLIGDFRNLYAAGEVLNIDGITGGFNFQAAWSESYVLAQSIATAIKSEL